jgi:S-adenosylmethionine:tRNA ribosyltransferase-isomerase
MRTADFSFDLPPELIAQAPAAVRDESRLLVLNRASGEIQHQRYASLLGYLSPGDVLVLNNSRVIPARLRGANAQSGGEFEILLLEEHKLNEWWVMLRPGKRARIGTRIMLQNVAGKPSAVGATVVATNEAGHRRLQFFGAPDIAGMLGELGEVPLPPYIKRAERATSQADRQRYQTVFAEAPGSVAAPTAGLHFTPSLLDRVRARGVKICFVTLHVGLATFAPVKAEMIADHKMHEERFELSAEAAAAINEAKTSGKRVFAVGTTTVRVLESLAVAQGAKAEQLIPPAGTSQVLPAMGRTRIFIYPPYRFRMVDALLTNFHLPHSTLLMLVSAFAAPGETRGRELVLAAYAAAVRERYRFYSYGDAMLLL